MFPSDQPDQINQELARAEAARQDGNDGMVRVCARRAVGIAVGRWLEWFPREGWRGDALHQLRQIHQDESFPLEIRQAADRLTTKITERKRAAFSTDPISDAQVIIKYLSARENL